MEAHDLALNKAKIQLMSKPDSAFFTHLCFSLHHKWSDLVSTAATNGTEILFNILFFMGLDAEERVFLMIHETMHCAYMHMGRLLGRDPERWNIACDYVINLQLVERGFKMPKCGLLDRKYAGMSAEQVYDLLPPQQKMPKGGIGNDLMDPLPGTDITALEEAMADILVQASIASQANEDKPGTIPGDIQIFLNKLLKPKLPYHRILQKYLQARIKADYTFRKQNKRFSGVIMPTLYSEGMIDMAVAVDTSGSITDEAFTRFVSDTHTMLRMMKPKKITFIQFDTKLQGVDEVRSIQDLMGVKFTGRGGTIIDPVFKWANENKPQILLVYTDGFFRPIPFETKVDTIWLINGNPNFKSKFGKIIHHEI